MLVIIATGLSTIIAGATTWGAFNTQIPSDQRFWCGLLACACWLPLLYFSRRGLTTFLRARRLFTDKCIHCGYPHKGLNSQRCPECGKDPCA